MIYALDVLRAEERNLKRRIEEKKVLYESAVDRRKREEQGMARFAEIIQDLSQDLTDIEEAISSLVAP